MKKYKNLLKYFQYDFCNKYYTKVKKIYIFLNNNYDKFNDIKTYGLYNAIDSYHEYYNNDIKSVYKDIEHIAGERLLDMLPDEYKDEYLPLFEKQDCDSELWALVKAADKISALIKCIEEHRMGNREFDKALEAQERIINEIDLPEVKFFREHFLPAYYLTLDEHTK